MHVSGIKDVSPDTVPEKMLRYGRVMTVVTGPFRMTVSGEVFRRKGLDQFLPVGKSVANLFAQYQVFVVDRVVCNRLQFCRIDFPVFI